MDFDSQFNLELQPVPNQTVPLIENEEQELTKQRGNCLRQLFFLNVYPIMKKAQEVTLEQHMIADLTKSQKSLKMHEKFNRKLNKQSPLITQMLQFFLVPLLKVLFILLILCLGQLSIPILIKYVIEYINNVNKDFQEGLELILIIILVRILNIFTQAHSRKMMLSIGYDAMSVVSMEIMQKCLKVSLLSTTEWTNGEITNLMQVDAQKLILVTSYISSVMMIPIQLGISLYLMYNLIGLSFLMGSFIILIMIVFNIFTGKQIVKTQNVLLKDKDERTRTASEVFSQIKFIKINALENHFLSKVDQVREKEIKSIKNRLYYSAINIFSVWLTPQLILSLTFGLYVYLGHQLYPGNTFAIISLFQLLQQPLLQLPIAINALIETKLSLNRIQQFLNAYELMTNCIKVSEFRDPTAAVDLQSGVFYWNRGNQKQQKKSTQVSSILPYLPSLKNINIKIEPGKFVSIIGDVGSGKSSFIQSLLGEMIYHEGYGQPKIRVNGRIAYVSQKPWIQNATVQDNIVFGRVFNEKQYANAIYYSCLSQDLNILINGDQTMIGEKGINLSGGQKARISLARAVYDDPDIILLDDPLSAVDVHVGNFIMKECLLGYLKQSTRILVTHALNYCKYTDYVYLFENGEVLEQGNFRKMMKSPKFLEIQTKFHANQQDMDEFTDISPISSQPGSPLKPKDRETLTKQSSTLSIITSTSIQNDEIDNLMILEERQKGDINMEVFLQYFAHNGGCFSFTLVLIIMVVWITCYLSSSIWVSDWTTASSKDNDFPENSKYFFIYFTLGFLQAFFAFIRAVTIIKQSIKSAQIIHNKMMNSLMFAPQCSFFERVPQGRIMNRLTKDINSLDTEIYWNISWLYTKLSQLISNIFLNIYASTYLVILPIIGFLFICMKMYRLYMKASRELQRLELISKSPILSYFTETLSGLTTIRAYQLTQQFLYNFANKLDTNKKIFYQQAAANAWFLQILGLSSLIVNISAIIYCISYTENPAFAGLLMTYASNIDTNILQTIESLSLLENGIISFERCLAYTKIQPEKRNDNNQMNPPIKNWPNKGEIDFVNFSVQYRQNLPPALKNLTFKINQKEKIGVVGRTGAGKSSITLSLLRILEALEGQILIDGVDISSLSLYQLRRSITIILQDAVIFNGSIRENLDPLDQCSDQEIIQTLENCCLGNLLNTRNGLDTKISEGGDNLSAGEKQLICIARAILKKNKIVLIDEATANIDIDTEHKIQRVIQNSFKDCTVITIAHRINTILHCDKIIVIDKGELKEFGLTQDLLNDKESIFSQIYQEVLDHNSN